MRNQSDATAAANDGMRQIQERQGLCFCGKLFLRLRPLQVVCSYACALKTAQKARKVASQAIRKRKEAVKPRKEWLQECQQAANAYCRERDIRAGRGCISCGTKNGKANGGHFMSVGARPELRFDEANINLQCERCNTYLHGNLLAYRVNLITKIGQAEVDRLEGPQEPRKYTIDELRTLKAEFKARARALKEAE